MPERKSIEQPGRLHLTRTTRTMGGAVLALGLITGGAELYKWDTDEQRLSQERQDTVQELHEIADAIQDPSDYFTMTVTSAEISDQAPSPYRQDNFEDVPTLHITTETVTDDESLQALPERNIGSLFDKEHVSLQIRDLGLSAVSTLEDGTQSITTIYPADSLVVGSTPLPSSATLYDGTPQHRIEEYIIPMSNHEDYAGERTIHFFQHAEVGISVENKDGFQAEHSEFTAESSAGYEYGPLRSIREDNPNVIHLPEGVPRSSEYDGSITVHISPNGSAEIIEDNLSQ